MSEKVSSRLLLQVGYEQRTTADDFVVSTVDTGAGTGRITFSKNGGQSYKELQVSGRYQFHKHFINASYVIPVHGDLNDFFRIFGNVPKPVIQPDGKDAWPMLLTVFCFRLISGAMERLLAPVFDLTTGFP